MVLVTPSELGLQSPWSDTELGRVPRVATPSGKSNLAADDNGARGSRRLGSIGAWEEHNATLRKTLRRRTYVSAADEYGPRLGRSSRPSSESSATSMHNAKPMPLSSLSQRFNSTDFNTSDFLGPLALVNTSAMGAGNLSVYAQQLIEESATMEPQRKDRRLRKFVQQLSRMMEEAEREERLPESCSLRLHRAVARAHLGQFGAAQVDVQQVLHMQPHNVSALRLRSKLVPHTAAQRAAALATAQHASAAAPAQHALSVRGASRVRQQRPSPLQAGRSGGGYSYGAGAAPPSAVGMDGPLHNAVQTQGGQHHGSATTQRPSEASEAWAIAAQLGPQPVNAAALSALRLRSVELRRNRPYPEFWRSVKETSGTLSVWQPPEAERAVLQEAEMAADGKLREGRGPPVLEPTHWDYLIPRVHELLLDDRDKEVRCRPRPPLAPGLLAVRTINEFKT
eukprot:SAG11_NODE_1386_length_5067_cov_1.750403_4_plen_453_part_00